MSGIEGIVSEAASRYASALLDLAGETKSLKTVEKDLKTLKGLFAKSDDLSRLASSPVITAADKITALTAIAKKSKAQQINHTIYRHCNRESPRQRNSGYDYGV